MVRRDAVMEAREHLVEGRGEARRLGVEQHPGIASRKRGVRGLLAQRGEMSSDGIGHLATHLLHGRVVEIQRRRLAQRRFAFPLAFELLALFFEPFALAGFDVFAAGLALCVLAVLAADLAAGALFGALAGVAGVAAAAATGFAAGATGGR